MPIFKPLTASKQALAIKPEEKSSLPVGQVNKDTAKQITERIDIIYDDSGSMDGQVFDGKEYKSKIQLAAEGTKDFMKACQPYITAVEIQPLCGETLPLSSNLPELAVETAKIEATGGTPLYEALGKAVDQHKAKKWTHIVIFTDGGATDNHYFDRRPTLFEEAKELGIPIDLILIGDFKVSNLAYSQKEFKNLADATGGTFLICKDGKVFKEKLKYFAPTLRHLLPSIASKES